MSIWLKDISRYWEDRKRLLLGGGVVRVGLDFLGGMRIPNHLAISGM